MFKKDIELRMEKGTLGARTTEPMHAEGGERRPAKKEKPAAATAKSNKRKAEPEKKVDECKIEDDDFFEF